MDLKDGTLAVNIARAAAKAETQSQWYDPDINTFDEMSGVFVTFRKFPSGDLRGCIGYPEPHLPLIDALLRSAVSACHDPRFPALRRSELNEITVEVTILSVPEKMSGSKDNIRDSIVIGRDGLIIEKRGRRGLLLPQVPEEWGWNSQEFLENLSMKAGLPKNAWMDEDSEIWRFSGEIFHETEPNGEIRRG